MFESVVPIRVNEARFHEVLEQQNLVRPVDYYTTLFKSTGYKIVHSERHCTDQLEEVECEQYMSFRLTYD